MRGKYVDQFYECVKKKIIHNNIKPINRQSLRSHRVNKPIRVLFFYLLDLLYISRTVYARTIRIRNEATRPCAGLTALPPRAVIIPCPHIVESVLTFNARSHAHNLSRS